MAEEPNRNTPEFYRRLPIRLSTLQLPPDMPRWRIELAGLGPAGVSLGLDLLGETVIGRGRVGNQAIDLDMNDFGGMDLGVSRRHAILKPTAEHLYIIDLGSTNGTQHNGETLGAGVSAEIRHDDTVTLGRMTFTIKIIEDPLSKGPDTGRLPTISDSDAPLTPRSPLPANRGE